MRAMRILKIEPEKAPVEAEITGTLDSMQEIVGGTIQAIYPFEDATALLCNDEGKILGLPLNRALFLPGESQPYDIIAGTFFICGAPENAERFTSLTEEQLQRYKQIFEIPQLFLPVGGKILVIPLGGGDGRGKQQSQSIGKAPGF